MDKNNKQHFFEFDCDYHILVYIVHFPRWLSCIIINFCSIYYEMRSIESQNVCVKETTNKIKNIRN